MSRAPAVRPAQELAPLKPNAATFMDYAFEAYWSANHEPEPEKFFTMREAFATLRRQTKLTNADIARTMCISTGYLGSIESGKRVASGEHYAQLKQIAVVYSLRRLTEFFQKLEDKAADVVKSSKGRKVKSGALGAGFSEIVLADW